MINDENKNNVIHEQTSIEHFVTHLLDNKRDGYYVELGAGHYNNGNNTYSLEKDYGWKGVSFEIDKSLKDEFNLKRQNPCMGDALSFNYIDYFEKNNFPKQIDFLQLDIDTGYSSQGRPIGNSHWTLQGLIAVPLNTYRFTAITFEHDANMYWRNISIRDAQREILDSFGYALVHRSYYEDWWVDGTKIDHGKFRNYLYWDNL